MMPFANIRLLAVAGPPSAEDFDSAASAGPTKWTGDQDAYLREQTIKNLVGGQLVDELVQTTLTVPLTIAVAFEPEDQLTFVRDGAEATRRVRNVQRFDATGTVRLTLWDA